MDIATAPVNYVDAQPQQLKENIAANKKRQNRHKKMRMARIQKVQEKILQMGNGSRTISNGKIWVDRSPGEEGRRAGNYRFW